LKSRASDKSIVMGGRVANHGGSSKPRGAWRDGGGGIVEEERSGEAGTAIAFIWVGGYKDAMHSISPLKKLLAGLVGLTLTLTAGAREFLVYFGTYTGPKSKGIYLSRLDLETGKLTAPQLAAETTSPSFLAVHPKGALLYAANEVSAFNGKPGGAVSAFAINAKSGALTPLNQQSSVGAGPCHLVVDKSGRNVLVANYGSGLVAALPLDKDGNLREASSSIQHTGSSVNAQRQKEPHAHSINLSPDNRFAFAADLGLDKSWSIALTPRPGASPERPGFRHGRSGSGPRHFAFHPSGKFAYVINEMTCTITAFAYDKKRARSRTCKPSQRCPREKRSSRPIALPKCRSIRAAGFSTARIAATIPLLCSGLIRAAAS
jgi:6-phosphogluconolactonase (cycloisomerase 2 family)